MLLLGSSIAYQIGYIDDAYWLLILSAPVLFFIGYQLARRQHFKKQEIIPIVVLPIDHDWAAYTKNQDVINEITNAVVRLRASATYSGSQTVNYQTLRSFLRTTESHQIARQCVEFGIYRKEAI